LSTRAAQAAQLMSNTGNVLFSICPWFIFSPCITRQAKAKLVIFVWTTLQNYGLFL
jgi:hypothetical protein